MEKLSNQNFKKARDFLKNKARPLDKKLFEFHFEKQSKDAVIEEVSQFQNDDGGFGKGIEPDFRLPSSSSMATSVGFQYLLDVNASPASQVVQKAVQWLIENCDSQNLSWEIVPQEINQFPGAPWWKYEAWSGRGLERWANPNAEITGILNKYSSLVPKDLLGKLNEQAELALERWTTEAEMYDFLSFQRLAENAPENLKMKVLETLQGRILKTVSLKKEDWSAHSLRPYWVVHHPKSFFFESIKDTVMENLKFEIQNQNPEGYWSPFWTWGDESSEWAKAETEWQGHLTLKVLKVLKNFDLIENS